MWLHNCTRFGAIFYVNGFLVLLKKGDGIFFLINIGFNETPRIKFIDNSQQETFKFVFLTNKNLYDRTEKFLWKKTVC